MIENVPQQPSWQDISLEEIKALLAEEKIAEALFLTRLRLRGIGSMPAELDSAIEIIRPEQKAVWEENKIVFETEIQILQAILTKYD